MKKWERFKSVFSDPAKVKDIKTLLGSAKDSASKDDYQMAGYQLAMARSRIEFHERFPEGQDAAMLADISKMPQLWRGAVAAYQARVDTTINEIAAFLDSDQSDDHNAAAPVKASSSVVKSLFHSDAFDQIANIPDSAAEKAEKLKWREDGLAEIRRLQALISDPRIIVLEKHPFTAASFTGHYEIGKTLMNFEKTILLSVKSNA
jgi:hypothetical protein